MIAAADACDGLTLQALEVTLKIGKGGLSRYKTGGRGGKTIDAAMLHRFARYTCVDFEWLVTGVGDMYRTPSSFEEALLIARRRGVQHKSVWRARSQAGEESLSIEEWLQRFEEAEEGDDLG